MIYTVTCLSKDAATLNNTSSNESLLFTQKDGVQAGTDYTCHVTMTVTAHNGTYLDEGSLGSIWTRTTPKSEKASVTTIEGKGWSHNSLNLYREVAQFLSEAFCGHDLLTLVSN